jgi:cellulose synthase/poly-beta-1,6-N-acetylglucosamine synthase-like glycosyltransferase
MIIVSAVLLFLYAACIIYYFTGWFQLPVFTPLLCAGYSTKVTVIIPARNEAENIANCITDILQQTYPKYLLQIIVVNDHSTDNTAQIVQNLAKENSNILLANLTDNPLTKAYKKLAIEKGVQQATGELIICTDADCMHKPKWVEVFVQYYLSTNAQFIAAPVVYQSQFSLLSVFQTLDFMMLQGITASAVHKKVHSMCNGANLAYTKAAYTAVNGFEDIDKLPTGDDMLLMYKIQKKFNGNIGYLKNHEAIVTTIPPQTITEFTNQRTRWASKTTYYDDKKIIAILAMVYLFNCWLLVLFIAGFFNRAYFLQLIIMLICKTAVELLFMIPLANFYKKQKELICFPFLQPIHIIYIVIAGWLGKLGNYTWKGRQINTSAALKK